MSDTVSTRRARLVLLFVLAATGTASAAGTAAGAIAEAEGPSYSLAADAAAGFLVAAEGLDPATADSAATSVLSGNFLHRLSGEGWGLVLNHSVDLSGFATQLLSSPAAPGGIGLAGSASASVFPSTTVHEAYVRVDLGEGGGAQLYAGKRRMGLGLGTVFSPGDAIDPRSGFWDQKTGFRGLGLAWSLGSELSLRAGLSLEGNLEAYTAGLRSKSATAAAAASAQAAYATALGSASGPADPRLLSGALSLEAQLGILQLAAAGVYRPDRVARASLGAGLDLGGLILQAEGAAEFLEGDATPEEPVWFATAGARYAFLADSGSLTLSLDYAFNGEAGALLKRTHYALPVLLLSWTDRLDLSCRALVELESPSALLSALLALHPSPEVDLELSALASLGDSGTGADRDATALAALLPLPTPGSGAFDGAAGLALRVHF